MGRITSPINHTRGYQRIDKSSTETADSAWKGLYRVGGAAALIIAVMYLIAMAIYIPAYRAGPPPSNVIEWFTLFQNNWLTGLFFLGLADIAITIFWAPMSLALYAALRPVNKTCLIVATPLVFVGMAVYLATNTAFSMLSLSHQYAAAATDAQESLILAAGQAILAVSQGTGALMGMSLVWVAGLIISAVMLRSKIFSKVTAYVGILGFALLLASVPFATYTTTESQTGVVAAIVAVSYIGGGVLSLIWYILVGLRLYQLGRLEGKTLPQQS